MAFRTDLAAEACLRVPHLRGAVQTERTQDGFSVTETVIETAEAAHAVGKPVGRYLTLALGALIRREEDAFVRACGVLSELIRTLLPQEAHTVLVVGLGNRSITPDAVGPQTVANVIATRHLITQAPEYFADWRPVAAAAPGVLGQTGIETGEIVRGLVAHVHPNAVIAVDALAAGRISHLMRTVQCADVGIVPGAGVDNARTALDRTTLGVPVLAVGVPTVADGASIAHEILRETGGAESAALRDLTTPVLVTGRDIDREVREVSRLIGYAINLALHPGLTLADIDQCL
ncbi:MAG: GPR endopeptidase [Butyricicoccus sp.]|nr:GPR endopeptidase [Butyricicoccus sp.]